MLHKKKTILYKEWMGGKRIIKKVFLDKYKLKVKDAKIYK